MCTIVIGLLSDLFRGTDPVIRAARDPDRARFAEVFGRLCHYFLCLPPAFRDGLPADASPEELIAQVRAAAEDLSKRQEFPAFSYSVDGTSRFPIFTQERLAREFIEEHLRGTRRIVPFQAIGLDGRRLVAEFDRYDVVVLNDKTKHQYELSSADRELMKHRWA